MKPLSNIFRQLAKTVIWLVILVNAYGCTALNEVRFTVEPSSLDYAQFRISRTSAANGQPETVRIDLSGSGYLEMTTGRSERVTDSFWRQSEDPAWQDLQKTYVMLPAAQTRDIFQRMVDMGIFDRKQPEEITPPPHDLAVLVAVGFKKRLILTRRKDYHQLFDELESLCRNPAN